MSRFLRVITFSTMRAESAVDAAIRDTILPSLLAVDDVETAWFGRTGSAHDNTRVLATTWSEPPSSPAEDVHALADPVIEALGGVVLAEIEVHPPDIDARFARAEPARVLRIFHGEVKPNELDAYIAAARDGMHADGLANPGLVAFA